MTRQRRRSAGEGMASAFLICSNLAKPAVINTPKYKSR
jgi:hypothetical protein